MKLFSPFKKILSLPKKVLIPLVLILIGIVFFVLTSGKSSTTIQSAKVQKQDLKQEVSASGVLSGKNNVSLHFKISGKLSYLNVKVGDTVKAGQVIAGLDTQDLSIALQQAQNSYRSAQAAAENAEDQVKNHDTDETFTQKQTRTAAQAARDSAFDAVKAAQRNFQDATLISPIDGTVIQANPLPGQNVSLADTIVQVVDFSQIVFEADVDEADISKVSVGQNAEVTLNAYGDKVFPGTVAEIIPQTKTTSNGATVVTVKIALNSSAITNVAGLNGQASIIQSEKNNVLAIPQEALLPDDTVFVQKGNTYQKQKVVIGFKNDTDAQVISGLNEGETVITNPNDYAKTLTNRSFVSKLLNRG